MKVIYNDAETTGFDPKKNELVQFAAIIEVDRKVVDQIDLKFRPIRPEFISADALAVTKKTKADLMKYPKKDTQFKKLLKFLEKHVDPYDRMDKLVWAGHNAPFDQRFVEGLFKDCGNGFFGSYFDRIPIDSLVLAQAMKKKGLFKSKNLKLETLAEVFKIEYGEEGAHDALADVRVTRELIRHLMGWIKDPPGQVELPLNK